MLEERTWKPDEKLVSQGDDRSQFDNHCCNLTRCKMEGDIGDTFFMIYDGQALLVVRDDQGEDILFLEQHRGFATP